MALQEGKNSELEVSGAASESADQHNSALVQVGLAVPGDVLGELGICLRPGVRSVNLQIRFLIPLGLMLDDFVEYRQMILGQGSFLTLVAHIFSLSQVSPS